MTIQAGSLLGKVALHFDSKSAHVPASLSAAARGKDGALWLAGDEKASLEVLRPLSPHAHELGKHRSFDLGAALGIDVEKEEADIEGLDVDGGGDALWLVGSHSAVRKKPKGDAASDLARLGEVDLERGRFSLARVAMGRHLPKTRGDTEALRVARLPHKGKESLIGVLKHDDHLGPFLPRKAKGKHRDSIPGKDNGFDIEGLAVWEDRLLLGLRGPVLRGHAFVLELELEHDGEDLALSGGLGKRRYRKHALALDGLGVRELVVRGDDVLVLAGPTMTLDGAHRLFRWRGPRGGGDSIVSQGKGELEPLFDLPWGPGCDHAEGIATFDWFDPNDSILVVYDSPHSRRCLGKSSVLADVFAVR